MRETRGEKQWGSEGKEGGKRKGKHGERPRLRRKGRCSRIKKSKWGEKAGVRLAEMERMRWK